MEGKCESLEERVKVKIENSTFTMLLLRSNKKMYLMINTRLFDNAVEIIL